MEHWFEIRMEQQDFFLVCCRVMIHEGSIVGEVRALLGLSDDAFWVAGDAVGQDSDVSTEYSRPTQGVVFVFQTLCCFCRGPTPIGEKLYRWSYDCVDITFDHSQGVMLLCNGGRTFRVSCCEDFAAIAFATQHLQKLAKASFAATKPSHGEEGATAAGCRAVAHHVSRCNGTCAWVGCSSSLEMSTWSSKSKVPL